MKKRILWALLTILLLVGMLSTTAFAAETEEITTPEELCEVQEPIQQTLESDNAQLHKLAAPTNVAWHKYYPYGCTGTDDYFTYNGMMSWIVGDPDYNQLSRVTVYKDDEEQYCTEWTYDTEWADRYYTDWDLSLSEIAWRGDGEYRFTVQAVGDGVTTADSDIVSSDTWTFTMPDTKIATPTNLTWDGTTAKWTEDDNAAGFVIEILYSADDGAATSTKSLTSTQKYVQYYGESGDTNGTDETAGWSIYEPGYYYFKVYSVSNDITKNWHSDAALSPAYAHNIEEPEEGSIDGLKYSIVGENVTITAYTGDATRLVIPAVIEGKTVTDINEGAFEECTSLEEVVLPEGLLSIGNRAFKYCTNLKTIQLPSSLQELEEGAFWASGLQSIVIPEGITVISSYTFEHCEDLTSVTLPESVTTIGLWAFSGCSALREITIPKNVTVLEAPFYDCGNLAVIYFLGDAVDFYDASFSEHNTTIYYPCDNETWTADVLQDYGGTITCIPNHTFEDNRCVICGEQLLLAPIAKAVNVSSSGKPKVSWNAVEGATEYKVYRSTSKNGTYKRLTTVTGTSVTNNSAVAGTQYYYYVVAVDGNGAESEKSNIVTRTCDLPRPELKISVVASTGKLKLSWGAIDGAVEYELYRSTDGGKTYKLLKTTTKTSLTHTGAVAGNKYYYKVKAIHSKSSANSAFSSAKYGTCDLPRPEVKISVVASTGKLKLRWDAIEGAVKYEVYRSTDGGETYKLLKTTTGTSLTNTSVTAGNKYYYKVKAIHSNSNANSAYSSVKYGTCDLARPTAAVKLNSKGKPVVSWGEVAGAEKYIMYIYDADGNQLSSHSTTNLQLTHVGADKGETYSYRVMAVHSNTSANSAKSNTVSITAN